MSKCNFNKVAKELCSPVNLLRIFRIPFPRNTSGWQLLKVVAIVLKLDFDCGLVAHENLRSLLEDVLLKLEQDVININYRKNNHFVNILFKFMNSHTFVAQKYIRVNQEIFMTKALNKTITLWLRLCNIEDMKIKMLSREMPIRIKKITESVTQSCFINNVPLGNFVKFRKIRGVFRTQSIRI